MNLGLFIARRRDGWNRLDTLIGTSRGRPDRLSAIELHELGSLYRTAVADLARLRAAAPGDPEVTKLTDRVVRARQIVYGSQQRSTDVAGFFTRGYWQLIASRPWQLAAAAALLLGPAIIVAIWAQTDPVGATGLVPEQFRGAIEPGPAGTNQGFTIEEQTAFSAFLFVNNVSVSLLAFGLGALVCVGGAWVLVSNGLTLGAVAGLLVTQGDARFFVELVAAHGVLELSCVVIAAAAGFRVGWAFVEPGNQPRVVAVREAGLEATKIAVGTIPWFLIAAIIEAFVSRRGIPAVPVAVIGVATGLVFWSLIWRARPSSSRNAQSRSVAFASR